MKSLKFYSVAASGYWLMIAMVLCFFNMPGGIVNISHALACYAFLTAAWLYYRFLPDDPAVPTIALAALALWFCSLLYHQPQHYTYDVSSHRYTLRYYAAHLHVQPQEMLGEAHQPPLYYMLGGLIYRISGYLGSANEDWLGVASLNFFTFAIFLLYGVRLILATVETRILQLLGVWAIMFWPANMLHCYRISNDSFSYLAFAGCLYHFTCWYKDPTAGQLKRCLLWLAFGFVSKNSAMVLLLIVLLLAVGKQCTGNRPWVWIKQLYHFPYRQHRQPLATSLLVLLLCIGISYGRNVYNALLIGNTTLIEGRFHAHSDFHFTPQAIGEFNLSAFLATPYAYNPLGKDTLFWNFYLRTLSFGEYYWHGWWLETIMNALMVTMWGYVFLVISLRLARRQTLYGWLGYFLVTTLVMVAANAYIRMLFGNYVPWADTRHLYAVMIFFILTYLHAVSTYRNLNPYLYKMGVGLLFAYMGVSCVHDGIQFTDPQFPRLYSGTVKTTGSAKPFVHE